MGQKRKEPVVTKGVPIGLSREEFVSGMVPKEKYNRGNNFCAKKWLRVEMRFEGYHMPYT